VGILTGFHDRLVGNAKYAAATTTESLGLGQDFFVMGAGIDAVFYSRHCVVLLSGVRQHGLDQWNIGLVDRRGATQLTLVLGGLFGEDVTLERLTPLDGAIATNPEALGRTPVGFHFGHKTTLLLDG